MRIGRFTLALGLVLGAVGARASTFEPLAFRDVVRRADLTMAWGPVGRLAAAAGDSQL